MMKVENKFLVCYDNFYRSVIPAKKGKGTYISFTDFYKSICCLCNIIFNIAQNTHFFGQGFQLTLPFSFRGQVLTLFDNIMSSKRDWYVQMFRCV